MDSRLIEQKYRAHLLETVGRKPTEEEMKEVDEKMRRAYDKVYDHPDKDEALINEIYSKEISPLWVKVVANENLAPEIDLFSKYTQVKPDYNITSFASGLAVYELFLAKEIVPHGKVSCIDVSEGMNRLAREYVNKLGQKNIEVMTSSVLHTPLESDSQDIVLARRTGLSKDKRWPSVLGEAYRIMKKSKDSTFIYTVDKVFNDPLEEIKSNLGKANLKFIAMEDSHTSNSGIVCMIIAKPNVEP